MTVYSASIRQYDEKRFIFLSITIRFFKIVFCVTCDMLSNLKLFERSAANMGATTLLSWGSHPSLFPPFSLLSPLLPFSLPSPVPFPSPSLGLHHLNPAMGSGERCKLPQLIRAEPGRQTVFGEFRTENHAFRDDDLEEVCS